MPGKRRPRDPHVRFGDVNFRARNVFGSYCSISGTVPISADVLAALAVVLLIQHRYMSVFWPYSRCLSASQHFYRTEQPFVIARTLQLSLNRPNYLRLALPSPAWLAAPPPRPPLALGANSVFLAGENPYARKSASQSGF